MTQEEKDTLSEKLYPDYKGHTNPYEPGVYTDQEMVERKREAFIAGLNHAESTHSKDIGELVKALEATTKILNDYYKGYAPESDAHKQIFINLPLIQKHSSNT